MLIAISAVFSTLVKSGEVNCEPWTPFCLSSGDAGRADLFLAAHDDAVGAGQPQDAEAGAEALLGVVALARDRGDQRLGAGADRRRLMADLLRRPVGVAPVARWHVVAQGCVAAVRRVVQMRGDALAVVEDLDRLLRHARPHLLA